MEQKWTPAPNAGTSKVALQSQLGVSGRISRTTPLEEIWRYIGRSDPPIPADWSERYTRYFSEGTADNKKRLPAVNVSTICESLNGTPVARRIDNVSSHTGLIVIDYDKITAAHAHASGLKQCEHVLGAFVSPSGNGVKAIVPVNPIPCCVEDHRSAYEYVLKALKPYGCIGNVDDSGTDPVRLMFAYSHTPFRMGLNIDVVPVMWTPLDLGPAPAIAKPIEMPIESDLEELVEQLRRLDLRERNVWLPAMGAARTAGLSFQQWDSIASDSPGYIDSREQRRRWDADKRRGKSIPPKTIFRLAKDQNKLMTSDHNRPVVAIDGSKASTSTKSPASDSEPSTAKETPSTGEKASSFECAEAFIKYADESGSPHCFWPERGWMYYGDHGWELDPKAAQARKRLGVWAEGPQGVAMQAPTSNYGRRGVAHDAECLRWNQSWDDTQNVGLPNRGVLVMGDDGMAKVEHGNWRHYISKRAGGTPGFKHMDMTKLWATCVEQWMERDDVRLYVQVLLGSALLGRPVETRSVLYIQSASGYGKSTFLDALLGAFGDYGLSAPPETFIKTYGNEHPAQVARLQGRRLVVASELPRKATWNAARIKHLSGGEMVAARFMRQDFFEFRPQFLIVLSGNHDPKIAGGESEGFKQRLRLVRWSKRGFTNPDRNLADKLDTPGGREAVLQWVVTGAQHYVKHGLPEIPESMKVDCEQYCETSDWLEAFKKTLEFGDQDTVWCTKKALKDHYDRWASNEEIANDRRLSNRELFALLLPFGCRPGQRRVKRGGSPQRVMNGCRPKASLALEPEDLSALDD